MSRENVMTRKRTTRIALESAFGVVPSSTFPNVMTGMVCLEDDFTMKADVEALDVMEDSIYRLDPNAVELGFQSGEITLRKYLGGIPTTAQLVNGTGAAELPLRILLKHVMGAEHADEGSTVATGTSSTVFDVASGHGSRFIRNQHIAVVIGGELEWSTVVDVSTDTITVSPAFSATPSTSAVVRNGYTFGLADDNQSSIAIRRTWESANAQMEFRGCYGDMKLVAELGKLPILEFPFKATHHTGPSAQSLTATSVSADMSAPSKWNPKVYLGSAITRAATTAMVKAELEYTNGWQTHMDLSSTNGVIGVQAGSGSPRAVKLTTQFRYDTAEAASFLAGDIHRFAMVQKRGSGSTASLCVIEMPRVQRVTKGTPSKVGEYWYVDQELHALADTLAAPGGGDPDNTARDIRRSPLRITLI